MAEAAPVIVIYGVTGDLSKRRLLPALYHLVSQGLLPEATKIIGVSRQPLSVDTLLGTVELCVLEKDNVCDPAGLKKLRAALDTIQIQPTSPGDYAKLASLLDSLDNSRRLFYMSVPSASYQPIIENLAKAGLNDQRSRLLLEKPFGYSLSSAQDLINLVDAHFEENQIYRIDHYLAKATAQSLLSFRSDNPGLAKLWNAQHIKSVRIKANEMIGIEGRVNFYEQTGALRDFVQSHLMQLLAITMMDLPDDMHSAAIHESKQQFFKQLIPADPSRAERGQYQGYRQEVGNDKSSVETYVLLHLRSNSPDWQATDMILETGKALAKKTTDITVEFNQQLDHDVISQVKPGPGISLDASSGHTLLHFDYDHIAEDRQQLDAYERVLLDAVRGDQSLFASDKDVIETWRVLQPLLDAWQDNDQALTIYKKGSEGPK